MQLLNNQMAKLVLLVVVVAVLLFALNVNYKKIGKEVALLGTLAVFLLACYLGHTIMNEPAASNNAPLSANNAPVYVNNVPVASNNNSVLASNNELIEGFQNNEVADVESEPAAEPGVSDYDPSGSSQNTVEQNGSSQRDTLSPEDLLPGSLAPNNWDTPANPGGLDGPNFLNPEHLVGINTVGQSLRNANRQLRSEPPNPQVKVSPWLQTTIEPDTNRRPMEIGGGCE
jgi:hypothetical protein